MNLRFDGQEINFRYHSKEQDEETGRLLWVYWDSRSYPYYEFLCRVDAQTERVVSVSRNLKWSVTTFMGEEELRSVFAQRFSECGLSDAYLYTVEYKINTLGGNVDEGVPPIGAPTGTVTVTLNDAGDRVQWLIAKVDRFYINNLSVKLADPDVYPDELADFYVPNWC